MTKQLKNSFEQLFNIAQAVSQEVINLPDYEVLDEAKKDPSINTAGVMAKNAYLKALQTTNYKDSKELKQTPIGFNLANTLIRGMNVNTARQRIMRLTAANDPSLQLVATKVNTLTDDEVLETYQRLLLSGALKPDSEI
ncbi:MAG: hypothetical protein CTY35_06475 [Methylotenera sp.]|nr:MAG: hypothetical protein CTY35_06475 [Methylotenera sp.]